MSATVEGAIPLRERRSLADEWNDFDRLIVPRDAPEVQRIEMRRAFYAGAATMFSLISGGLDSDKEPTDLDVAYLETLNQELMEFGRLIGEGKV
jgi:hypothetical protein